MKWRDVIIGALASLLVTIVGGVAIFYATKEPDEKKTEKLVYSVAQAAQFSGSTQDLSFCSIVISNVGGVAADNVAVSVSLAAADLKDLAVSGGAGLHEKQRRRTAKGVRLDYDHLLPKESVTINLLMSKAELPKVDVRSDATLGEKRDSIDSRAAENRPLNRLSAILVPFTGALAALAGMTMLVFLRRRGLFDLASNRNNTGFLLMHSGMHEEAFNVLSAAVRDGGGDQYTLSNYAVSKALRKDFADAESLLKAANFRDREGHAKAVVIFNEGLVRMLQGNRGAALDLFRKALSMSPKQIGTYCKKSVLLEGARNDPAFGELFSAK